MHKVTVRLRQPQAEVEPQAYSLLITVLWRLPKLSSIPQKHRQPLGKSFWPWGLCTWHVRLSWSFHPFILSSWDCGPTGAISPSKQTNENYSNRTISVLSPKRHRHVVTCGQLAHDMFTVARDPSYNKMTSAIQFVFACNCLHNTRTDWQLARRKMQNAGFRNDLKNSMFIGWYLLNVS